MELHRHSDCYTLHRDSACKARERGRRRRTALRGGRPGLSMVCRKPRLLRRFRNRVRAVVAATSTMRSCTISVVRQVRLRRRACAQPERPGAASQLWRVRRRDGRPLRRVRALVFAAALDVRPAHSRAKDGLAACQSALLVAESAG